MNCSAAAATGAEGAAPGRPEQPGAASRIAAAPARPADHLCRMPARLRAGHASVKPGRTARAQIGPSGPPRRPPCTITARRTSRMKHLLAAHAASALMAAAGVAVVGAALVAPGAIATAAAKSARRQVAAIVEQIRRADYEGDRPALKDLFASLGPFVDQKDKDLAARVRYWRGFALWRRALNGFNESAPFPEQERDLTQANDEFRAASVSDPGFVDAKIGSVSCLGNLMYLNRSDADALKAITPQLFPILKETTEAAPDNPRLLWILGPVKWNMAAERGGGQDRAIEGYLNGLDEAHRQWNAGGDPLDPSWGEPELYMSLAWSYLNRDAPDIDAAEKSAQAALRLVPYWHYVRDILMQQIQDARARKG